VRLATAVTLSQLCCALFALVATIWLLSRARTTDVVRLLGFALMVIVVAGPALWPWYLLWSLVPLAATSAQRSKALAVVAAVAMLAVRPNGSAVLTGDSYLVVLAGWAGLCAWLTRRRRWRGIVLSNLVAVGRVESDDRVYDRVESVDRVYDRVESVDPVAPEAVFIATGTAPS
jgi:alpha-1,6-mannosyltransferase